MSGNSESTAVNVCSGRRARTASWVCLNFQAIPTVTFGGRDRGWCVNETSRLFSCEKSWVLLPEYGRSWSSASK
jgi:hypothetical protein